MVKAIHNRVSTFRPDCCLRNFDFFFVFIPKKCSEFFVIRVFTSPIDRQANVCPVKRIRVVFVEFFRTPEYGLVIVIQLHHNFSFTGSVPGSKYTEVDPVVFVSDYAVEYCFKRQSPFLIFKIENEICTSRLRISLRPWLPI